MAYPHRCGLCRTDYTTAGRVEDGVTTIRTDPGQAPSRRHPERRGRCLLLRCLVCTGEYWWDDLSDAGRPPAAGKATPARRR